MAAVTDSPLDCRQLPFEVDAGVAPRAAIGVVVLATDQTIEHEFRTLLDLPGVGWYSARIPMVNDVTPQTLAAMEARIADTTDLILPGLSLDVVAYGCTSASMVIGEQRVFKPDSSRCARGFTAPRRSQRCSPRSTHSVPTASGCSRPTGTTSTCRCATTSKPTATSITAMASFKEEDDNRAGRIRAQDVRDAAIELGRRGDVDMVFVSCTSLRLAAAVREIEDQIGKPVTSSNHAMAWHCLRLAGIDDQDAQHGRLFTV